MKKLFLFFLITASIVCIGKAQAAQSCVDLGTCGDGPVAPVVPPTPTCRYASQAQCQASLTDIYQQCTFSNGCWNPPTCNGTTTFVSNTCGGNIPTGYSCVKSGNCYVLRNNFTNAYCQAQLNNSTCRADSCPAPRDGMECTPKTTPLGTCYCLERPAFNDAYCQAQFNNSTCLSSRCPKGTATQECKTKTTALGNCYCLEDIPFTDGYCRLRLGNATCRAQSCPMPLYPEQQSCTPLTTPLGSCYCLVPEKVTPPATETVQSCPSGTNMSADGCCCLPETKRQ